MTHNHLEDRVADALRRIDALESAYETITIAQLVSMRARTHGPITAIDIFERGQRATYAEMDCLSNKYAHALRKLGVKKGDRVAVMLPNRIEFPLLWFAFAKLGAVFDQCIMQMEYLSVLKGSPRKQAAMRFLEFVTRPEQQGLLANKLGVTPATKGAEQHMDERVRRWQPDLNNGNILFQNEEYWRDNYVGLQKRFQEWILT